MPVPFKHKDLLVNFVSDNRNAGWARDLVCLALTTGGNLTDDDKFLIWNEIEDNAPSPSLSLPSAINSPYPKIELLKLTHVQGVNLLASNQDVVFCNEGITLLYGQNRSGKSGYFRILNQLAEGEVNYILHPNVFAESGSSKEVVLEYVIDGVVQPPFHWDCASVSPRELRHIRCFDTKYAATFLQPRTGNSYLFESYNLRVFRAIHDTLRYLEEEMGVTIDTTTKSSLTSLCTVLYRNNLQQALVDEFRNELNNLGMGDLKVDLMVDDLMVDTSQIAIRLVNNLNIEGVLSEAEQKCAALALFLAECDLMEVKQPVIFDDPVNSLDAQIIQNLSERILDLDYQVIVFTHNDILSRELAEHRNVTVFKPSSSIRVSPKKHMLAYDVISDINATGYVMSRGSVKSDYFLNKADAALKVTPFLSPEPAMAYLRRAVEEMVDEKVFQKLSPLRYRGHSSAIEWVKLKGMVNQGVDGDARIEELRSVYEKLSGRGAHLGALSSAATLSQSELIAIFNRLIAIV